MVGRADRRLDELSLEGDGTNKPQEPLSMASLTPGRLAWVLHNFRDELMERWSNRVLRDPEVPDANRLTAPVLEDHIPELIDRFLQRLERHVEKRWGEDGGRDDGASAVGIAHARQRFEVDYTLAGALRELSHFRSAVIELCGAHDVSPGTEEWLLLNATIDEMMRTSASEFERASVSTYELAMGVIAHDLRNPLNAIALYASRLRSGNGVDTTKAGDLLERNARIMTRLVEDLLVFSKIEAGHFSVHPTDVDLCALVRSTCENYLPIAHRRKIDLSMTLPKSAVHASCDGDRITQALWNLVGNALKFTPEGGSVRIELEVRQEDCALRVHDSGPGVPPEHVEDIFRPFWQAPGTSTHTGGAGLGLAIARGVIEAHGGQLALEPHPPPGSVFVLTLPFRANPKSSIALPPPSRAGSGSPGGRGT